MRVRSKNAAPFTAERALTSVANVVAFSWGILPAGGHASSSEKVFSCSTVFAIA